MENKLHERGILFHPDMVRSILDGRKTQTRRVINPQQRYAHTLIDGRHETSIGEFDYDIRYILCPYGQPGTRMWVRETWQQFFEDEIPPNRPRGPKGEMGIPEQPDRRSVCVYRADGELSHPEYGKANWIPSIHMPRWASRITLEITGVRVERVQDISEEDIRSEGTDECLYSSPPYCTQCGGHEHLCSRDRFRDLWDSLNVKRGYPWDSNPWVWVVEFRRVKA